MNEILSMLQTIRILDVLDMIIVAIVFYRVFLLIKGTRAEQLVKGLIILLIISKLSDVAKLYAIHYILDNTMRLGFIALLIVFQPELRRALEYIGRKKLMSVAGFDTSKEFERLDEIVNAVKYLSKKKIGALIILERTTGLREYINTGIALDARISSELLITIFKEKTPLHDGAVIIRGDRIVAANAYLPLSSNKNVSQELGTRHRAGIGLSEVSDAYIIIVSEETGVITTVKEDDIDRFVSIENLQKSLSTTFSKVKEKNGFENSFNFNIKNFFKKNE